MESTRTSSGTPEQCQCLRSRWRTLWQVRQGPFISGDRSIAHLRGASELKPRPMTAKRPIPACCHPGCQRHLLCSLAAHFCSAGNDTMSSQAQRSSPLGCDLHLHSCRSWRCISCGAMLRLLHSLLATPLVPQRSLGGMYDDWLCPIKSPYDPYDPRQHQLLITGRYASPHNASRQERPKFVKKTACSRPLMTRHPRTGNNAPAGYFISVSVVT